MLRPEKGFSLFLSWMISGVCFPLYVCMTAWCIELDPLEVKEASCWGAAEVAMNCFCK